MITMLKPIATIIAILTIGLLVGTAPATANGIPVTTVPSDTLTVYKNGVVQFSVSATEGQENKDDGHLFYISPEQLSSFSTAANIFLCDPNGKISDVFGIFKLDDSQSQDSNGESSKWALWNDSKWHSSNGDETGGSDDKNRFVLGFISDPLDFESKQCGKSITCVPEGNGGSPGNATLFLSKDLRDKGWTATFMSDSEVPEPATTGLFFGMVALGLCIWKRRTTA